MTRILSRGTKFDDDEEEEVEEEEEPTSGIVSVCKFKAFVDVEEEAVPGEFAQHDPSSEN